MWLGLGFPKLPEAEARTVVVAAEGLEPVVAALELELGVEVLVPLPAVAEAVLNRLVPPNRQIQPRNLRPWSWAVTLSLHLRICREDARRLPGYSMGHRVWSISHRWPRPALQRPRYRQRARG